MKRNIVMLLFVLIMGILTISATSAFIQNQNQVIGADFPNEVKDSECSSIILQVSDNESVSSFRRDENDSAEIFIDEGSGGNLSYIKQHKKTGGEFFQCLITENGYVIGVGGGTDGHYNEEMENITSKMVLSGNSTKDISKIRDILRGYKKGHYIIKAPDGSYDVAWPSGQQHGKLKAGEYICVPNLEKYSFKGNFTSDPVEKSIMVAGEDVFGITRRDIITYHYINNDSGVYVDIFASNDDGSIRGFDDTGNLNDDISYGGKKYSGESLPAAPNKTYLGTSQLEEKSQDFFQWFWNLIKK